MKKNTGLVTNKILVDIDIGKDRIGNKEVEDRELVDNYIEKYDLNKNCEIIYTDESKQERKENIGIEIVVSSDKGYNMTIDGSCSIYTAASLAIEKAIGIIEEQNINKDILVLTDSQSVCIDLKNNKLNVKKHENITRIRERIDRYCNRNEEGKNRKVKVVIGWILGHDGIRGNEIADGLAKEAINEEKDERIKIPHVDWKIVQKVIMEERTKTKIEAEGRYKGIKYFKECYNKDTNKP